MELPILEVAEVELEDHTRNKVMVAVMVDQE
jgi:hypothetical protein